MGERKSEAFDHSELREIIRRKLGTELEFAKRINISRRAVSMKLNGHWDWKRSEMIRACDALGMNDADIMRMFFQRREDLTEETERSALMQEIRRWTRLMERKARADGKALRYVVRHHADGSYTIFMDTNVSGKEISEESNAERITDTVDSIFDTEVKVQNTISESSDLGTIVGQFS